MLAKAQVHCKYAELNKKHSVFHQLVRNVVLIFGRDEAWSIPTPDDYVWDSLGVFCLVFCSMMWCTFL